MNDREYSFLKTKILGLTGIDLNSYKTQQMRRRLEGFIARSPAPDIIPYCKLLEREQAVLQKLKDFLTINVSEFFRDLPQFEMLRTRVLPQLLSQTPSLNIWSAGCSMGAEPYSIALILEQLSPQGRHHILGTDLDQNILARARAGGPYTSADIKNIDLKSLNKFFTTSNGGYWARDSLRGKVEFRQQNLLSDSFDGGFDLIVCRNVVIYFSDEAKSKLNRQFYRSLKKDGMMFIGGTETLLDAQELGFHRLYTSFYEKRSQILPQQAATARPLPARAA